jgi:hypothetical protein
VIFGRYFARRAKNSTRSLSWLRFSESRAKARFQRFQLLRAYHEDGRSLAVLAVLAVLARLLVKPRSLIETLQYWLERYRTFWLAALA